MLSFLPSGLVYGLTSLRQSSPELYQNEQPRLDLQRFFEGTLEGGGLFQNSDGKVLQRFTLSVNAKWDQDTLHIKEVRRSDDGAEQQQDMSITMLDAHHCICTGSFLQGKGQGEIYGNSARWQLPLKGEKKPAELWQFLLSDDMMISHQVIKTGWFSKEEEWRFLRKKKELSLNN